MKRPEGEIVLMCKGADSVVLERLKPETDPVLKETTNIHLSGFANAGEFIGFSIKADLQDFELFAWLLELYPRTNT